METFRSKNTPILLSPGGPNRRGELPISIRCPLHAENPQLTRWHNGTVQEAGAKAQ